MSKTKEQKVVVRSEFCDKLGTINAAIADLKVEAEIYKVELISIGAAHPGMTCALEGDLYRVAVSFGTKTKTDYKAAFEELIAKHGMDADFVAKLLAKHTETAEGVPSIRVSARKVSS